MKNPITYRNSDLHKRKDAAIPRGLGMMFGFYAGRALNAWMWDIEGNRYIDLAAGVAVCNTGHRHPKLVGAVRAQLDRFYPYCVSSRPVRQVRKRWRTPSRSRARLHRRNPVHRWLSSWRAIQLADGYRLTGSKAWITDRPIVEILAVWANNDKGIVRRFVRDIVRMS